MPIDDEQPGSPPVGTGGAAARTSPRYGGPTEDITVSDGWSCREMLAPSQLVGANGIRLGPDGALYVAENFGSEISKVDVGTGAVTLVSGADGHAISPDDLAFDEHGNMYITEVQGSRVGVIRPDGSHAVVAEAMPSVNGIATLGNRLFVNEFRPQGRIVEVDPDTGELREIVASVDFPNGMTVTSDGRIYYPRVMAGEIWHVGVDGGDHRRIADGLAVPTAVKRSRDGYLFATEHGGGVVKIDPSGAAETFAVLSPGLDNLDFGPTGQVLVSNSCEGSITEVDRVSGDVTRHVVEPGLTGPFGLAVSGNGDVIVADPYAVIGVGPDARPDLIATDMSAGFPGVLRGICLPSSGSYVVTTTAGAVVRWDGASESDTLWDELDTVIGVASDRDGSVAAAVSGDGRLVCIDSRGAREILATDLGRPVGVTAGAGGAWFVTDAAEGRVWEVGKDHKSIVATGLVEPQGIASFGDDLYVVDRGAAQLVCISLSRGEKSVIASGLPLRPSGARILPGVPGMVPGPWLPFADIVVRSDRSLLVGADGSGTILEFRSE